ncbi:hypothetical protein J2Z79_003254 [Symbiobacterium terraclitae]|uniref:Uncharacterized protein n=1 Tax=Symbiobacterium terraclitae TaxID=557451 RepID=A0ABS4JW94_9FIRM|nr:hypothetical protein [Symbiobacterium terraclitae]MBP2019812.1 hypothetical protein [Symbiobacterium terraclitae]
MGTVCTRGPGGLAAGLHTGDAERILDRVKRAGLRLMETREFTDVEILPTREDLALYLSRIPGFPDYTQLPNSGESRRNAGATGAPRSTGGGSGGWQEGSEPGEAARLL